jgi:hypothetical protein
MVCQLFCNCEKLSQPNDKLEEPLKTSKPAATLIKAKIEPYMSKKLYPSGDAVPLNMGKVESRDPAGGKTCRACQLKTENKVQYT